MSFDENQNSIKIKSYPAKNGDAFLIRTNTLGFAMLIDAGYPDTFNQYIKPDLKNLATEGQELNLVVATHVDTDHISGLLAFFGMNGTAKSPTLIPVHEVFHNSLRSLVAPQEDKVEIRPDDAALLREIRLRGYPPQKSESIPEQDISARQGSSLAQLLSEGGYRWNTHDGSTPIGGDGLVALSLPQAQIKVLGPNKKRLAALKKWWISEIRRMGFIGALDNLDDIFEYLCAHEAVDPGEQQLTSSDADLSKVHLPDNSVTNGSSISLLIEVEGIRLLFLGDSWSDDMVAELEPDGPTIFDAIKISHHGSLRNTSTRLLSLIDSSHFFISTNGSSHSHPDFAVLKAIVDRPASFLRTLHFNYSTPASRKLKAYQSETGADFVVNESQSAWVTINKQNTI